MQVNAKCRQNGNPEGEQGISDFSEFQLGNS